MTSKIIKELSALTAKEQAMTLELIEKLLSGDTHYLDIKKLKGKENMFRLKKGKIRILYTVSNDVIALFSIRRRDDNTYNL